MRLGSMGLMFGGGSFIGDGGERVDARRSW